MKNIIFLFGILIVVSGCAAHKDYQGAITKNFTTIAGASEKFKSDSLFKKTTVTLSTYSEFISIYNLQNKPKTLQKTYNNSLSNYAIVLDTLARQVQNTTGYESNYSQSMNYIINDVKAKFVAPCLNCPVRDYRPLLAEVKVTIKDKNGQDLYGYTTCLEPAVTYSENQKIEFAGQKAGIVPGYYKIWIEKDGRKVKEKYQHIKNQSAVVVINFVI